jgi:ketosteroid isomerase-like protein
MSTMMRVCGILIAAGIMTGTALAQSAAPEIVKTREAYAAATNAGDIKSIVRLYTEDGVELPPNEAMVKGSAALEKHYTGLFKGNAVKLSLTGIETTSAGDIGYDVGTYSQTITPGTAGAKPITDRGKYIVILRRGADKQWKVKYAIYNSDLPPQPMK